MAGEIDSVESPAGQQGSGSLSQEGGEQRLGGGERARSVLPVGGRTPDGSGGARAEEHLQLRGNALANLRPQSLPLGNLNVTGGCQ
jgi:hypothetical protein